MRLIAVEEAFAPVEYIDAIPPDRVVQYHLAGHTNKGTHIVDTHSDHAIDEVWKLYARSCQRTGLVATLYEWDDDIPAFDVVFAEARKAQVFRKAVSGPGRSKPAARPLPVPLSA